MIELDATDPVPRSPSATGGGSLALSGFSGGSSWPRGAGDAKIIEADGSDPIAAIERVIASAAPGNTGEGTGAKDSGWLVLLSYELGRAIEPKARCARRPGPPPTHAAFPLAVLQRWVLGEAAVETTRAQDDPGAYTLGRLASSMGKPGYVTAVERTLEYIGAGDIYQANIAHRLVGSFSGDAAACFADLARAADPRFGAMMRFDHRGTRWAILSISPELFIAYDPKSRIVRTEPMKGTRPLGSDEDELRHSAKDRAELDMITDLMRNDLGRICTLGSVRVIEPRRIEPHGSGVLQASSIIEGELAPGAGLGDIIRGVFPPGSVTGAPKVRAMQIIDELEGTPRDAYCGSLLVLDDAGAIRASVAIRTAQIRGGIDPDRPDSIINGRFVYPVGAGIVADSDPRAEWEETLTKAAILRSALGAQIERA